MSKFKSIADELKAVVTTEVADLSTSDRIVVSTLLAFHLVTEAFEAEARDGTPEERAALKADVLAVVHDLLSSLDIPYVPDYIENTVKGLIEVPLSQGLDQLGVKFAEVRAKVDEVVKKSTAK